MEILLPLALSAMGVAVAAAAFARRDDPAWSSSLRPLMALAIGEVMLGAASWLLLAR